MDKRLLRHNTDSTGFLKKSLNAPFQSKVTMCKRHAVEVLGRQGEPAVTPAATKGPGKRGL